MGSRTFALFALPIEACDLQLGGWLPEKMVHGSYLSAQS